MSATYILKRDHQSVGGATVDIVAQRWEEDRRWAVGERDRSTGSISFYHRTYETLGDLCHARGLNIDDVRRNVLRPEQAAALAQAAPAAPLPQPTVHRGAARSR